MVGAVEGRTCVLIDDMIDTGGTLASAAELLMDRGRRVGDHRRHPRPAVGPGGRPAQERARCARWSSPTRCRSPTDKHFDSLTVLSIAPIVAEALDAVFEDTSVSEIFRGDNV